MVVRGAQSETINITFNQFYHAARALPVNVSPYTVTGYNMVISVECENNRFKQKVIFGVVPKNKTGDILSPTTNEKFKCEKHENPLHF